MDFPDGSRVEFLVSTGRVGPAGNSVYDTALYDEGVYDGATAITWTDYQSQVFSIVTKAGKDAFLKRFRTATATIMLDNSSGQFVTGAFIPGDLVWVRAFSTSPPPGLGPQPIDDGTTWLDSTRRTWTANGDGLIVQGEPSQNIVYNLFFGRVDSAEDIVRGGADTTKVRCVDMLADLASTDRDPQPAQGAGEDTGDRIGRIAASVSSNMRVLQKWPPVATMQETTLSGQALTEAQTASDSEGGDFWADTEPSPLNGGQYLFYGRDWLTEAPRSTNVQWALGSTDVPLVDGRISKDLQLVVNDASFATTGGTEQNVTDQVSVQRYGQRTTRRLDLVCVGDTQPAFLASRAVANLASVRPRVRNATVTVETWDTAVFGLQAEFGDLTVTRIDSIFGWANAFAAHIIGIEHQMWHDQWTVTVKLDDAFVDNVDGAFRYDEFSDAYSLGGHPAGWRSPQQILLDETGG